MLQNFEITCYLQVHKVIFHWCRETLGLWWSFNRLPCSPIHWSWLIANLWLINTIPTSIKTSIPPWPSSLRPCRSLKWSTERRGQHLWMIISSLVQDRREKGERHSRPQRRMIREQRTIKERGRQYRMTLTSQKVSTLSVMMTDTITGLLQEQNPVENVSKSWQHLAPSSLLNFTLNRFYRCASSYICRWWMYSHHRSCWRWFYWGAGQYCTSTWLKVFYR